MPGFRAKGSGNPTRTREEPRQPWKAEGTARKAARGAPCPFWAPELEIYCLLYANEVTLGRGFIPTPHSFRLRLRIRKTRL